MKKQILAAIIAATSVAGLHAQTTIVNYSTGGTNVPGYTGFFNSADGWNNTGDPFWEGQQGWTGTGAGADSVSVVAGITPSGAGNASGTLGVFLPALPVPASVALNRAFAPMSTALYTNIAVGFTAEWSILDFGGTPPYDQFVFDLRNSAGNASVLSFSLQGPGDTLINTGYNLDSIGSATVGQLEATYGALLRMQVDLAGTAYTGAWELLDGTTRTVLGSGSLTGGTLAGGFTASDFDLLRLTWNPGDVDNPVLGIVVNEFTIISTGDPVPEPGTWAVGALLLSGAAAAAYRRRKAQGDKAAA